MESKQRDMCGEGTTTTPDILLVITLRRLFRYRQGRDMYNRFKTLDLRVIKAGLMGTVINQVPTPLAALDQQTMVLSTS
jgi:hypothetical protein